MGSAPSAVKYVAVIEKSDNGYAGYIPDLPGCVAAGDTRAETESLTREAVFDRLEMLREGRDLILVPLGSTSLVEVGE